ncbi:hypothetical protein ACSPAH_05670 [Buttiauxella agrestis]
MLLLAFGWLFVNSQVAVASHDCPVEISASSLSVQHSEHMLMENQWDRVKAKGTLCDKHCIPDVMQKDNGYSSLVALPVTDTLALVIPECQEVVTSVALLTPPATGPPPQYGFVVLENNSSTVLVHPLRISSFDFGSGDFLCLLFLHVPLQPLRCPFLLSFLWLTPLPTRCLMRCR